MAIALPVISVGFTAQQFGMRTAGVGFAVATGVLAVLCLATITVPERRSRARI